MLLSQSCPRAKVIVYPCNRQFSLEQAFHYKCKILMVLEIAESFWNLVSKERFLKLKDLAPKCSQFGNTCV